MTHPSEFTGKHPVEIQESLRAFRDDYSDPRKVAFVMMRFKDTLPYKQLAEAIRTSLAPYGISALRADDKQYHSDLFSNVLTYVFGRSIGIAVFERIETDGFNPNVALEVGYMLGLRKPICFLKDQTLPMLPTDLIGQHYRTFDTFDPQGSVGVALTAWLHDLQISGTVLASTPPEIQHPLLFTGDACGWTPEQLNRFFTNLKADAAVRARREYEGHEEVPDAISDRARELVNGQLAAYGLTDLFQVWKLPRSEKTPQKTAFGR